MNDMKSIEVKKLVAMMLDRLEKEEEKLESSMVS